ncbi:hypothetical protein [Ferrimonas kyonanensis]|uniref:hypothetical protein n=1 Tax=Ferrimonas kyonanensis TaxID=364763 RepID=UPI00048090CA|nr:hypothetical protein [Ferrimonas kyonanensis]
MTYQDLFDKDNFKLFLNGASANDIKRLIVGMQAALKRRQEDEAFLKKISKDLQKRGLSVDDLMESVPADKNKPVKSEDENSTKSKEDESESLKPESVSIPPHPETIVKAG